MEREKMGSFCAESERAKSLERKLEGCVLLCLREFFVCGALVFVYALFPELWPCALDSKSLLPLLGFKATRRKQFVLSFLVLHYVLK